MANKSITQTYEELPKIAKILLQIFLGWLISGVYRIIRWTETKNTVTLVVGIVALLTGSANFVFQIIDLVTEILNNRISVLAD